MSLTADNLATPPSSSQGLTGRTRYRFRITMEGFMLLLVMILVGFAAWHSGTNLLYLIFAILIAFYLLHGGLLWINLSGLATKDRFPETVVVHQPFDITTVLTNRKRFSPSYAITVTHSLSRKDPAKKNIRDMGSAYFSVVPRKSIEEGFYSAVVHYRGFHEIVTSSVCTRYPFGFEERSQVVSMNHQILALPAIFSVANIAANLPFGFGDRESQIKGAGTDIYGLREYVEGEHARNIHWPTSARAQKLIVSEYSRDERRQVVLLLNNGSENWKKTTTDEFENAVTLTASVASHLITTGFEVGLITADAILPIGQGPTQLLIILKHLATLALVEPRKIDLANAKTIKIIYESQGALDPVAWQSIDSRAWSPPDESLLHGEKQL